LVPGKTTEPTPKKHEEFGPRKRAIFLENLRKFGSVYFACRQANIARSTAYDARNSDADFARAWESAKEDALDLLEASAHKRAHNASDTLIIFLLKAGRPEKYRDVQQHYHSGPDGNPIQLMNLGGDTSTEDL
jgi:hypothetical protein